MTVIFLVRFALQSRFLSLHRVLFSVEPSGGVVDFPLLSVRRLTSFFFRNIFLFLQRDATASLLLHTESVFSFIGAMKGLYDTPCMQQRSYYIGTEILVFLCFPKYAFKMGEKLTSMANTYIRQLQGTY